MTLAYLDPGSGSIIASAVVGGAAAAGVAVRQARAKFSLGRKKKAGQEPTPEADEATPAEAGNGTGNGAEPATGSAAEPAAGPATTGPTTVGSDS